MTRQTIIVAVILMVCLVVGCLSASIITPSDQDKFQQISQNEAFQTSIICVENVQYLAIVYYRSKNVQGIALSVMLDSDGVVTQCFNPR